MSNPTSPRYAPSIIALHWLTVLLIVLAYATMEFREIFEKGSPPRELLKSVHYSIGLTILALTLWRIIERLKSGPAPAITPPIPPLMQLGANGIHLALYALLILMPILGWMILSAEGKAIPFWGVELPGLIGPDKAGAETYEELHEILGKLGYALIGLHAAAAIFHHRYVKDNTLVRMMPKPKSTAA